ncbi:hypothetical protein DPMN_175402 [Dreissena polymorpha]|uniref:Uncharacterized protein n=1 Tax=Dreissena polymorpha TaxID=45954 RepID=A0A9D4E6E9_DREPO|nr:hypothetical protein DPMN_175402 [Dreissena polymorpha]
MCDECDRWQHGPTNDSCPPFYLLAKLLHDKAVTATRNAELVSDLKLRRYQRASYATGQGKTFAL